MGCLVILNPAAGTVGEAHATLAAVRDGFSRLGVDADVRLVRGEAVGTTARDFLARAGRGADDIVVAGGGDGTIGAVAHEIAGSDVALGVLPLGTLNHFAKDLGLPLVLEEAIAVIAAGVSRRVDVAEVNGRVFVNNSSVGLYPLLVAHRDARRHRRRLGKLAATILSLGRVLRGRFWQSLVISIGAETLRLRTPCLFIGNNTYDPSRLGRRDRLDGGKLGVVLVTSRSLGGLLLLPFVALMAPRGVRDLEELRCDALEVSSRGRRLRVSHDGEVHRLAPPLRYRTRPGALRVMVPV